MTGIFQELRRRNVFRVTGAYVIAGWVLAQVAGTLEEALNLPAWFDTVIVAGLLIGFPIAFILAWAFEMTPEGVKLTPSLGDGETADQRPVRKLDYLLIAGLVLVAVMIVVDRFIPEHKVALPVTAPVATEVNGIADASIAVLPFSDLSPAGDQVHFSEGIAEEILNLLVSVKGLDVTSRTSSFQFRNREIGVPEIAAQLKVRYVLEGSVRKSGETVRVTGQLIDASKDIHLWSQTFDRPLTAANLFAIQDEISTAIVTELGKTLGLESPVEVKAVTDDVDAYALYLEARPLFHERRQLARAETLLARAVELDPNFARAWELRAAIQGLLVEYGENDVSAEEHDQRVVAYANRALELDPNSATAMATLALLQMNSADIGPSFTHWQEIIADLSRALELEPRNGSPLNWRGLAYMRVGYLEEALTDLQNCVKFEPYYTPCRSNEVYLLLSLNREQEAFEAYLKMGRDGALRNEYAPLALLAKLGEKNLFMAATNSPNFLYGWRRHDELYAAFRDIPGDHMELSNDLLRFFNERGDRNLTAISIAAIQLGNFTLSPHEAVTWSPGVHRYRQSPEFHQFIQNTGIYDFWRETGFPPQCRPVGKDDFACD